LEVVDLEPRTLQRQLRLAAALADRSRLLARRAHLLVSAAEPLLRLLVPGPRPPELVAEALRLGEKAAQLLLRDLSLRLQRGVALEAKMGEFLFALLVKQPLDLRVGGLDARTELLHSLGRQLQPRLELLHRVRQLLHFAPLVQQSIPDALERAAGNDALL